MNFFFERSIFFHYKSNNLQNKNVKYMKEHWKGHGTVGYLNLYNVLHPIREFLNHIKMPPTAGEVPQILTYA